MHKVWNGVALAAALTLVSGAGHAADNLIPGKLGLVKSGKLAKLVAKPATEFPLPPGPDFPTAGGGSIRFFDTGGAAGDNTFSLPAGSWSGLGNPPGSKGFKYKGAGAGPDACVVVIVKPAVIKAVCKGTNVTVGASSFSGNAGVILSTGAGTRYCASFGGTPLKNDPGNFKRKDAPAPGSCPGVATTTTTTTSTTSTTAPCTAPVCGDNVLEQPCETCDDGNTSNNDTCPSDCAIDPCTPIIGGTPVQATVRFSPVGAGGGPPPGTAAISILLDFPEGKVNLPGSGGPVPAGTVTLLPQISGSSGGSNNLIHALRQLVASQDPFDSAALFRVNFRACSGAPAPTVGEFTCTVLEASDVNGIALPTLPTCSVTLP